MHGTLSHCDTILSREIVKHVTNNTGGMLMSEGTSIRRSSSRAGTTRKPKKNQLPIALAVVVLIIAVGIFASTRSANAAIFWITGIAFGFVLQKARFCFTASMRDPYLTGGTSITRAVLIAFALTTIGFTAIKYGYAVKGLAIPGMSYVVPISGATAVGAIMFGTGMVIAGGCASGTLMRVGEMFHMNMISLVFFIVGSLLGSNHFGWWKLNFISNGPKVFLPDYLGWFGAVAAQLTLIAVIYIIAAVYEKRRGGGGAAH